MFIFILFLMFTETSCDICPTGKYSTGNGQCLECSSGQYTNTTGAQTCAACTQGQYQPETAGTNCSLCPIGWFSDDPVAPDNSQLISPNIRCNPCPMGQYQPQMGQSDCDTCPVFHTTNTYGSSAKSNCTECGFGDSVTQGVCHHCSAGQYEYKHKCINCTAGRYGSQCKECPKGFSSGIGVAACQECSTGRYSDIEGLASPCKECSGDHSPFSCSVCPAGQHKINGKSQCQECPAGKWSLSGEQGACQECLAGQYQDQPGKTSCKECPEGWSQSQVLSQAQVLINICTECSAGYSQSERGQDNCQTCPIGYYATDMGNTDCLACQEGHTTRMVGATTNNQCYPCPPGYFQPTGKGTCNTCQEGQFQDQSGKTMCKGCGPNELSSSGSDTADDCFSTKGLRTYVFGMRPDSKPPQKYTKKCEIRPNMVMLCPTCACDDDSRNGFWDGPICNECRRGFATTSCTTKCPAYDGIHDSTMCNGNGDCWYGKNGNGLCYCGGKSNIDPTVNNAVVDVRFCPKGQICSGYGIHKQEKTRFLPVYYIMKYRQYSVFVLQLDKMTPGRGHMWFKRFPPGEAYKNTCSTCISGYDNEDSVMTEVGYWDKDESYKIFLPKIQVKNGFNGENCQYECALCLGLKGNCNNVPHPYLSSYALRSNSNVKVLIPETICKCGQGRDPENMCCPYGFQPYIYFGKRPTDAGKEEFTHLPFITDIKKFHTSDYWTDMDLWLQNEPSYPTPYYEPADGKINVSSGSSISSAAFKTTGPYNHHIFYGTEKQMCMACPGLFGKGVTDGTNPIETHESAQRIWWNRRDAGPRKCNSIGVCDFYTNKTVNFFGELGRDRLTSPTDSVNATKDRFDTCFTYTKDDVQTFGLFVTQEYTNGEDPFLGGLCPFGHFCTEFNSIGYKEACPPGYYQPEQSQTRTEPSSMCSNTTAVNTPGCTRNRGKLSNTDYVDNICKRCPRNSYASRGARECTECPSGKVKKVSGALVRPRSLDTFRIENIPTWSRFKGDIPWYYIPDELGREETDCATVPRGIIHVPSMNKLMTYKNPAFLPVLPCPFAFTSEPGTFTFQREDDNLEKIVNMITPGIPAIVAPYAIMKNDDQDRDFTTFIRRYCRKCPEDSVTGPAFSMCTTCRANRAKTYLKEAIQKMIDGDGTQLNNVLLTQTTFSGETSNCIVREGETLKFTDVSMTGPASLSECILKCSTDVELQYVRIDFENNKCQCAFQAAGQCTNGSPGTYKFEYYSIENHDWNQSLPLCVACQPGQFRPDIVAMDQAPGCRKCDAGDYQDDSGQTRCKQCAVGRYSALAAIQCIDCPYGYVQPQAGQSTCEECAKGKYDNTSTSPDICYTCPDGQYQPKAGQTVCLDCPAGFYSDGRKDSEIVSAIEKCKRCPDGQHQLKKGQRRCFGCLAGYQLDGLKCICPKGHGPGTDVVGCWPCPQNTYADEVGKGCASKHGCTTGSPGTTFDYYFYRNNVGVGVRLYVGTELELVADTSNCVKLYTEILKFTDITADDGRDCYKKCSSGFKYSRYSTGKKKCQCASSCDGQCKNCPIGKYTQQTGLTALKDCAPCPIDTYADQVGKGCKGCPIGKYTDHFDFDGAQQTGLTSLKDCWPCPINTYADQVGKGCKGCPIGKYTDHFDSHGAQQTGQTSCGPCPINTYADQVGKGCKGCPIGKYTDHFDLHGAQQTGQTSCGLCPINTYADQVGKGCKSCPPGEHTQKTGLTSNECECDKKCGDTCCAL